MSRTMPRNAKAIAIIVILSCCAAQLSSCANRNDVRPRSVEEGAGIEEAVVNDPDLYFGDLGVEDFLYDRRENRIASWGKDEKTPRIDPNGFPLNMQFPNPSVRPIRGTYVENIVKTAKSYLGTPYVYGSDRTEPSTFDCSDFTRWVFLDAVGMDLPWDSRAQAAYVKAFAAKTYTSLRQAKRGDLLFFTNYRGEKASDYEGLRPSEKPVTHTAIYLGNGKIIHSASKLSGGVRIDEWSWRQLHRRFLFGGGILPAKQPAKKAK